jgi:putative ABC transport system permease protein
MVSIARKNLFQDKTRLAISSGGVAVAIVLILTTVGLYLRADAGLGKYILETDADLWVSGEDTINLFAHYSIPSILKENLLRIEGVRDVTELIVSWIRVPVDEKYVSVCVVGYDTQISIGGPWNVEGAPKPNENEAIVDRIFAKMHGLEIGDEIKIADQKFTIVGISDGTDVVFFTQYIFISIDDARRVFGAHGIASFFLVSVDEPDLSRDVANKIEENIAGVSVFTREVLASNTRRDYAGMFIPLVLAIAALGTLVGTAVISITVYTATVEKRREYGILKAIGASNVHLYKTVINQALIMSILGFITGIILFGVVQRIIEWVIPGFVTLITIPLLVGVLLGVCFVGLIASFLPARRVAQIDPSIVFRA